MNRAEMLDLVTKVFNVNGDDDQLDAAVSRLKSAFPNAKISDMIFYPDTKRNPEQIVDEALRREAEYVAHGEKTDA